MSCIKEGGLDTGKEWLVSLEQNGWERVNLY